MPPADLSGFKLAERVNIAKQTSEHIYCGYLENKCYKHINMLGGKISQYTSVKNFI